MMTLDEKEILINKVCCNILRRVCKSVNDSMPILPEKTGKYDLEKVMEQALQEYKSAVYQHNNKKTEKDEEEILNAIYRDITSFVKMMNK